MQIEEGRVQLVFDEVVTVKGRPRLVLRGGEFAPYVSGSGTPTLIFGAPAGDDPPQRIDLNGGAIIATEAAATLRPADLTLPSTR